MTSSSHHPLAPAASARYHFDTSAIRGLSRRFLGVVARIVHLQYSPYTFWEIYSHLDEDYPRFRAEVLKLLPMTCLDAPLLELAGSADAAHLASPLHGLTRPEHDRLMEIIVSTTSLDEFEQRWLAAAHSTPIAAPRGIRSRLERDEREFIGMLGRTVESFRGLLVRAPTWRPSGRDIVRFTESATKTLADTFRRRSHDPTDLEDNLARAAFLYYAYVVLRAFHYASTGATIDVNDAEDANILLHLDVGIPTVFVCSETFIADAVNEAVRELNVLAVQSGQEPSVRVQAMSGADFRQQFLRQVVQHVAYELWVGRGCRIGHDLEDWFDARRELRVRDEAIV